MIYFDCCYTLSKRFLVQCNNNCFVDFFVNIVFKIVWFCFNFCFVYLLKFLTMIRISFIFEFLKFFLFLWTTCQCFECRCDLLLIIFNSMRKRFLYVKSCIVWDSIFLVILLSNIDVSKSDFFHSFFNITYFLKLEIMMKFVILIKSCLIFISTSRIVFINSLIFF